jgi:hypothetical protein
VLISRLPDVNDIVKLKYPINCGKLWERKFNNTNPIQTLCQTTSEAESVGMQLVRGCHYCLLLIPLGRSIYKSTGGFATVADSFRGFSVCQLHTDLLLSFWEKYKHSRSDECASPEHSHPQRHPARLELCRPCSASPLEVCGVPQTVQPPIINCSFQVCGHCRW